ncbi:PrpF domain-containing protein [Undibacterium arcticum]
MRYLILLYQLGGLYRFFLGLTALQLTHANLDSNLVDACRYVAWPIFFLASDLPADIATRDRVLLAVLGSPDKRQIDGLGGANPLTSKVGIVSKSSTPGVALDFLFLPNCNRTVTLSTRRQTAATCWPQWCRLPLSAA